MKKFLLPLFTLFTLLSATTFAQVPQSGEDLSKAEGQPDLEQVKRAKFRETYVNMEADFSKYDKIYFGDAFFDYRDVGPAETTRSSMHRYSSKSVFGISQQDRDRFEQEVSEAFRKELEKGKRFTITDSIDDKTMIMRGAVIDIVSHVPPEFVGRSEVYLASVGEATLRLEFLDGQTGEVLARVSERRKMEQPGGRIDQFSMPANSVTVWNDVRRWARSSASRLRAALDDAMK